MKKAIFAVVLAVCFVFVNPVFGQREPEKGFVEFGIGSGYRNSVYLLGSDEKALSGHGFMFGPRFGFGLAPERDGFLNRLGFVFGLEYTPVTSQKFTDPFVGQLRAREGVFILNPALSIGILRREKFELIGDFGLAASVNRFSVQAKGPYGWESLCRYYEGVCDNTWSARSSAGVSARIFPKGGNFYYGVRVGARGFGANRNFAISGTIGYSWRTD